MANLNVTYSDMRTAAQQLAQGQLDIESKLSELKSMIDGLVNSGYVTDSSSRVFAVSYQDFTDGAKRTIQGLEGMGAFLKNAADLLEETDNALARGLG